MFGNLTSDRFRWLALVFLALGLAIVIIDNTVLNVAVPYILRDLNTTFDLMQWVISGYALIIATLLITAGRLGDIFGRKRVFIAGLIFFATGSFIASISQNVGVLFLGEALIEAIGASFMLTSSLSLLATEFHGRERALAFGIWGSVAGASASVGPLLGGFLTTYYSWRWSLRINVVVAIVAILGSVFIKEARGEHRGKFDFLGTVLSGIGLFSLIFGFIEGRKYGWISPNETLTIGSWAWPFSVSIIPFVFAIGAILLSIFVYIETQIERNGGSPLLRMSMFKNFSFSMSVAALGIVSLGQFGVFFILPIFLQNVTGVDAFNTGLTFLPASLSVLFFGPMSGFVASRIGPKWIVSIGMLVTSAGAYILSQTLETDVTGWVLAPGLILFGMGIGMASAQLTNIVLSSVKVALAGEASAVSSVMRQVGTSVGIAVIGAVMAGVFSFSAVDKISNDVRIPTVVKSKLFDKFQNVSIEGGGAQNNLKLPGPFIADAVSQDVKTGLVEASEKALLVAVIFVMTGAFCSFFIPDKRPVAWEKRE